MSEPTIAAEEANKKSISLQKIITLVVLMASCYAVAFYTAQWVLGPDGPETAEAQKIVRRNSP